MVAAQPVSNTGQNTDTTATEPLQTSDFDHSPERDARHLLDTSEHPEYTRTRPKSATRVLRECADPDLARLIEAWPTLSDDARTEILRIGGIR